MRNITTILIVLGLVAAGCSGTYDRELLGDPEPARAQAAPPTYSDADEAEDSSDADEYSYSGAPDDYEVFDELDPHGTWYRTPDYGWVWQPLVVIGWQPYHHGHWIWTSYGWTWVSYEPFGWATYHYGYWWYDAGMGWVWVPDYQWSSCRVTWFYTDHYIGWAPLPPPGYRWGDPWDDYDGWTVIEAGKFKQTDIGEQRVPPARFKADYRSGTAVKKAPETRLVERVTNSRVRETPVKIDTRRIGDREQRRIIFPEDQRRIAERYPMPMPNPGTGGGFVTPPPHSDGSGVVQPPDRGKTRNPAPEKPKRTSPPKYKGGSKDDDGSSKDGKAKGDTGKDNGKSKGGDKDDKDDGNNGEKKKGKKG